MAFQTCLDGWTLGGTNPAEGGPDHGEDDNQEEQEELAISSDEVGWGVEVGLYGDGCVPQDSLLIDGHKLCAVVAALI